MEFKALDMAAADREGHGACWQQRRNFLVQNALHLTEHRATGLCIALAHRLRIKRHIGVVLRPAPMAGFHKSVAHAEQRDAGVARANSGHREAVEATLGVVIVAGAELHIAIRRALLQRHRQPGLAGGLLQHLEVAADLGRLRRTGGSRRLRLLDVEGTLTPFAGLGIDSIALDHYAQTRDLFARTPVLRRFAGGGATYITSVVTRSLPEFLFRPHPRVRIVNEGEDALVMGRDGRPIGPAIPRGGVLYDGPSRLVAFATIPVVAGGFDRAPAALALVGSATGAP